MTDRPLQVLLVEDSVDNRELAEFVLRRDGIEVIAVESGRAALEALQEQRPDAIALDLQLPDMDGLDIARRIKADPELRGVAIIAITARAMKGDEAKAREAGCDAYVTKPFDTHELSRIIAEAVTRAGEDA